ncbi:MAG: 50S ribosomal protein L28 [Coxiellaceae bacterium]|nr:MAG: 50S ribosomal protein L28 [Coxiellaceae bacterium]
MANVCMVTGKKPQYGNRVSHANNKTRHRFMPNLQTRKYWVPSRKQYVTITVSRKGIRTIDKYGIEQVLADLAAAGINL